MIKATSGTPAFSRMLKKSASMRRPLSGLSGLSGFWFNETNQMNQINQINKTNQINQNDSDGSYKVPYAGDYDCQVVRMLKKAASFLLASRKGSTYSEYASPSRSAAALLNDLFEHPERKDLVSVNGDVR